MEASGESVKSARRALEILELLAREERPLSFGQLAEVLGYPHSSLHALLRTLVTARWVELDSTAQRYALGIRSWEVGHSYLRALALAERARPYMEQVRDVLDETVQLAVLDGRHNVYVAKVDGRQRLVLASEVGRRLEAHATGLGKVLLAGLTEEELDERLSGQELERFTANTITDRAALEADLAEIRRRGYAFDAEEYTIGVRCVAVPVRDASGEVVTAMSVSVPTARFSTASQRKALKVLLEAANGLSSALGYHPRSEREAMHLG